MNNSATLFVTSSIASPFWFKESWIDLYNSKWVLSFSTYPAISNEVFSAAPAKCWFGWARRINSAKSATLHNSFDKLSNMVTTSTEGDTWIARSTKPFARLSTFSFSVVNPSLSVSSGIPNKPTFNESVVGFLSVNLFNAYAKGDNTETFLLKTCLNSLKNNFWILAFVVIA